MITPSCYEIYGIKVRIETDVQISNSLKRLFLPFNINCNKIKAEYTFRFKPKFSIAEIASFINPLLAKKNIWAFHSAGIVYQNKGFVFMGKSGGGKTTIAKISLKLGLKIVGDDIILMKELEKGIELIPFFFGIQKKDKSSFKFLNPSHFSSTQLEAIFILKEKVEYTFYEPVTEPEKEIYAHIFWALNGDLVKKQLEFVNKMCRFKLFYLSVGRDILEDPSLLLHIIEEIIE